jgi:DNA-binding MarR family transcriptional regulator
MMDEFSLELNELLVTAYRSVLKLEELMLASVEDQLDLSISELHMLDAISRGQKEEGLTISDIAQKLDITLPSVTVAINKMVKKGYVEKIKSQRDGRMVHVRLTHQGKRIHLAHRYFHEQMVRSVAESMTPEQKEVMLTGMRNLDSFFKRKISLMAKRQGPKARKGDYES